MEPEAAWMPWAPQLTNLSTVPGDCIQMVNGTIEPAVWAPGFPVEYEYVATEIFGSCLQTTIPTSPNGGQFIEYAAGTQSDPTDNAEAQQFEVDFHNMEVKINNPIGLFKEAAREFKIDMDMTKMKIHRYPESLQALGDWYTVPTKVAIGPYYHSRILRYQVERAKHVAAYHCVRESGHSLQEVYDAVVLAAADARHLYDMDVMRDMGDGDFLPMMFYDACFLVQYMLWCTHGSSMMDASLKSFIDFNRKVLRHDLMLFENQLPWRVVETVMRFRPVNLVDFISDWIDYLKDHTVLREKPIVLDDSYEPPHLLALLRFYIVGKSNTKLRTRAKIKTIDAAASVIRLAEIGITLTAAKDSTELIHMGVNKRGILSAELSLVPLCLDDERASFLVNMAALELCTTSNALAAEVEDSAVCSYLRLLSMLVRREEDVQELRTKHLLQGAGYLNKDVLEFFTMLESLPLQGISFIRVLVEIESYKVARRIWTKVHTFLYYRNKKTILTVLSVIGLLVSILGTLMTLKVRSKL